MYRDSMIMMTIKMVIIMVYSESSMLTFTTAESTTASCKVFECYILSQPAKEEKISSGFQNTMYHL